jgi:hypothetical protein
MLARATSPARQHVVKQEPSETKQRGETTLNILVWTLPTEETSAGGGARANTVSSDPHITGV